MLSSRCGQAAMANRAPRDRRPPDTAVVFCVTLRRRRRGELWADDAVFTNDGHDDGSIRTQHALQPTRADEEATTHG